MRSRESGLGWRRCSEKWLLLLCMCLVFVQWGCHRESIAVRRAKIRQYPKISAKVARSMMASALQTFQLSLCESPHCGAEQYTGKWRRLVNGMRPLMMSLSSFQLKRFQKEVRSYQSTSRYWRLPEPLRVELADLDWIATHRIRRARRAALRSHRLAKAELETVLEERDGVSKKALRAPRAPKVRVRRAAKRRYGSLGFLFPVKGKRIGSGYGWRRGPISRRWSFHTGVDIGARRGTPIMAAASGVVVRARYMGSCGYGVILRHDVPGLRRVTTTYCHMSRILVRRKQRIERGQTIGLVGSTGNSTGPHLHFAVHINRRHVHPRHHFRDRE